MFPDDVDGIPKHHITSSSLSAMRWVLGLWFEFCEATDITPVLDPFTYEVQKENWTAYLLKKRYASYRSITSRLHYGYKLHSGLSLSVRHSTRLSHRVAQVAIPLDILGALIPHVVYVRLSPFLLDSFLLGGDSPVYIDAFDWAYYVLPAYLDYASLSRRSTARVLVTMTSLLSFINTAYSDPLPASQVLSALFDEKSSLPARDFVRVEVGDPYYSVVGQGPLTHLAEMVSAMSGHASTHTNPSPISDENPWWWQFSGRYDDTYQSLAMSRLSSLVEVIGSKSPLPRRFELPKP